MNIHHLCADDPKIYISSPDLSSEPQFYINHLPDISTWMSNGHDKLDMSQTDVPTLPFPQFTIPAAFLM